MNNRSQSNPKKAFRALGRVLDMDELNSNSGIRESIEITLCTGRKVIFKKVTVAVNEVETTTYVDEGNIRISEELTEESLAVIVESIKKQQFQPVIAQKKNNAFSILDGSRRRQSAIYAAVGLDLLACDEDLTKVEVKQLAKELQSAEKHSARDYGRYYTQLIATEDFTLDQIAEIEGVSKSFISKCNKAWSIPAELIALFPLPIELSQSHFSKLALVLKTLVKKDINIAQFASVLVVEPRTKNDEILELIVVAAKIKKKKVSLDKPRKIVDIDTNIWVKTNRKGEKQVIELSRVAKDDVAKIEAYIVELLTRLE